MDRDFKELTAFLDSLEERFNVPSFDCAIAADGQVIYRHSGGGVDDKSMYWLYSATKLVTCAAAMTLIERGALSLDDPVSKYLPEYASLRVRDEDGTVRPARTVLTVRHLMTMTGGLDYDLTRPAFVRAMALPDQQRTTRAVAAALGSDPLIFEPGTRFRYSFCHDVLGAVMEVAAGQRMADYVRQSVLLPLGIEDATFHPTQEQKSRIAQQYFGAEEGQKPGLWNKENEWCFGSQYDSGGAGLLSTVDDYLTFLSALSRGGLGVNGRRILKPETMAAMASPQIDGQPLKDFWIRNWAMEPYGYGLGVRVLTDNTDIPWPVGEFGWDGAAGAYVLADPKRRIALFYVQHVYNSRLFIYQKLQPQLRDAAGRCLLKAGMSG